MKRISASMLWNSNLSRKCSILLIYTYAVVLWPGLTLPTIRTVMNISLPHSRNGEQRKSSPTRPGLIRYARSFLILYPVEGIIRRTRRKPMGIKSNREEREIPAMPLEEKEMSLLSFLQKVKSWMGGGLHSTQTTSTNALRSQVKAKVSSAQKKDRISQNRTSTNSL